MHINLYMYINTLNLYCVNGKVRKVALTLSSGGSLIQTLGIQVDTHRETYRNGGLNTAGFFCCKM